MSSNSLAERRSHAGRRPGMVAVLGGGIIGLACARELARWGMKVELFERSSQGPATSLAAAGMLAPLAEAPGAGLDIDLAREARDLWPAFHAELAAESGLDIEYDRSGALLVALSEAEAGELEQRAQAARSAGEGALEVSAAELRALVPDLAPAALAGLHFPGEHRVNNVEVCAALAVAAERQGVLLHRDEEVRSVAVEAEEIRLDTSQRVIHARHLVVAAGAWSGLLPGLPRLPVRPVRGQMLHFAGVGWGFRGIVKGSAVYAVRRGEQGLLVGATTEEAGFELSTTAEGITELKAAATRLLPGLGAKTHRSSWAGLRPGTADGLPILGRLGDSPVLYATGHYRNGILLAPWTARQLTRLLLDRDRAAFPAAFSPDRFTRGS